MSFSSVDKREIADDGSKSGGNTPSPNTPDGSGLPPSFSQGIQNRQKSASSYQSGVDTPDRFVTHCEPPPALSQRHLVDKLAAAEIEISRKDNEDGQRDHIRSDANEMRVDDGQHMIPSGRNIPVVGSSTSDGPTEIKGQEKEKGKAKPVPSPNPTKGHAQAQAQVHAQARARSRSRSQTRRPAPMDRSESKAKAFAFFGQVCQALSDIWRGIADEFRTTRHLTKVRMDCSDGSCILSVPLVCSNMYAYMSTLLKRDGIKSRESLKDIISSNKTTPCQAMHHSYNTSTPCPTSHVYCFSPFKIVS